MADRITLAATQTWTPESGSPRAILAISCATLVTWAGSGDKDGWCTERSFRAWIRKTKATLDV